MSSRGAPGDRRGSIRTCVGCRQRADKLELVRVVAQDRGAGLEVVPDPQGGAPGRGAHLHPSTACLVLALRRRAFARALRTEGAGLGTRLLEAFVHEHPAAHDTPAPPAARPTRKWSSSS